MRKPRDPGNINPCGSCTIYDNATPVATCLDTPAARGLALKRFPNATHGIAYYLGWKPERVVLRPFNGKEISDEKAQLKTIH